MAGKTLTRMDLSEAVFREVGLSRNESAEIVESLLTHVSDALVDGQSVKISSFGTFTVRDKGRE
jgi:integration host factor subunit alpha